MSEHPSPEFHRYPQRVRTKYCGYLGPIFSRHREKRRSEKESNPVSRMGSVLHLLVCWARAKKRRSVAAGIALALCGGVSVAQADTFTSAKFLAWPADSQVSYFRTSIGMVGVIASQMSRNIAPCIDAWYFADPAVQTQRNEAIRALMRKYPDYHPQAVILALVQKECGKFTGQ